VLTSALLRSAAAESGWYSWDGTWLPGGTPALAYRPYDSAAPSADTLIQGGCRPLAPWSCRQALSWLALRLRVPRIMEVCEARALLWGATQQLLDNARGDAKREAKGKAEKGPSSAEHAKQAPAVAHQELARSGKERGSNGSRPPAPGSLEDRQARAFARGRQLYRDAEPPLRSSIIHMLRWGLAGLSCPALCFMLPAGSAYVYGARRMMCRHAFL
jgi:hypothetical protein